MIALLGRPDSPTDAVEDYCRLLGGAFKEQAFDLGLVRVRWEQTGWIRALRDLWRKSVDWKGDWVLVQYTALMWSRRAFPPLFLLVLYVLRVRGLRTAVVFHDPKPYGGKRFVDKLRTVCQRFVMRRAYMCSTASILPVPLERATWLPGSGMKGAFIPVGANLPPVTQPGRSARNGDEAKTIAVFTVTDAGDISKEVGAIALAATRAAARLPRVRLLTVGRGSLESEAKLRHALEGSSVEFSALGILPAAEVSQVLADSDVSLFVRGPLSPQRGSAIASIASAVPLVAYADRGLAAPFAEAGIIGVPYLDGEKLAKETLRVLTNPHLWRDLHERSWRAHEKYFSWKSVAARFLEVLNKKKACHGSVTVVVPTYCRPGPMIDCIRSLVAGSRQPQEIIVVGRKGDVPTEQALPLAQELCEGKTTLRVGWVTQAGFLPPVEKGRDLASGDIVAFVDDDVTVTADWLERILLPFTDLSVGVVGGRVITPGTPPPRLKGRPGCISWYGKHWGNVSSLHGDSPIEVRGVTEGNWAWRRDLLVSVRFDPKLNFDDASMYGLDLCLQAKEKGLRVIYDSHAILYHHPGPRPPGLDRTDRPKRVFAYTRNYTYIMLKHLPWWRWPFFMVWWFLIGERSGWGLASVLVDTMMGRLPKHREVWGAMAGKVEGILISASGVPTGG